jgi:hypothetical protein
MHHYARAMTYRSVVADAPGLDATLNRLGDAGWTIVSVAGNGQSYLLSGAGTPTSYLIVCHGEGDLPEGVQALISPDEPTW